MSETMAKARRNPWITGLLAAAAAGLAVALYSMQPGPHPMLGKPAPVFSAETLDGAAVDLAKHLGKEVVLLDFWATWCPPCREALPVVNAVAKEYRGRGVAAYAVEVSGPKEAVAAMIAEMGIDMPVLLDTAGAGAEAYAVTGIPQLVIVGRDGIVKTVHQGAPMRLESTLKAELDAALGGV